MNWPLVVYAAIVSVVAVIITIGCIIESDDTKRFDFLQQLLGIIVMQFLLSWAGLWSLW